MYTKNVKRLLLSLLILICITISACGTSGELKDGEYSVEVTLMGGSGRASLQSPAKIIVKDGVATACIEWSSPNYDYMIVDGTKYLPTNTEGNSTFEIPVAAFDEPIPVIADTTAMSTPHEIEYEIIFSMNQRDGANGTSSKEDSQATASTGELKAPEKIGDSLIWKESMELSYAKGFSVDYYEDENTKAIYKLLTIDEESQYLVAQADLDEGTLDAITTTLAESLPNAKIIIEPKDIYLVASSVMNMLSEIDALDNVKYSALEKNDWYIDKAKEYMDAGKIAYAGKYSAPDYELLVQGGCGLAIENTMIYHSPEVREKLESFGIPVMIDRSSYELEPLGRVEWVKLYGAICGKEDIAKEKFDAQVDMFNSIKTDDSGEKPTVAFFYISTNGEVKVRKSGDYLPKMINLAGAEYIFSDLGNDDETATMSMQMEQFYVQAKDADYIIYNSTIDGELGSVADLIAKSELLGNMKAVQEGNVYCTSANLYQSSMELGTIILDINKMINGQDDMQFIYHID